MLAPEITLQLTRAELAAALRKASDVLEQDGRRHISAMVIGVGGDMRYTASAFAACAIAIDAGDEYAVIANAKASIACIASLSARYPSRRPDLQPFTEALSELIPEAPVRRTSRRKRQRRGAAAKAAVEHRRFLVHEYVSWMGYTGTIWAVGCKTQEAAVRAYERRIESRAAVNEEVGFLYVFDRERAELVKSNRDVGDPVEWARRWFHISTPTTDQEAQ